MRKLLGVVLVVGCLALISGCRTSKQGYVAKGNKLFNVGKYADAAINYQKAIQKDANYSEAYYRLGLVDLKEENPHGAFNALYRAVQLDPNNVKAKEQFGGLSLEYYLVDPHRSQRYYNLVKQTSDELLQKNPKSFEGIREKAYLATTDGKRDEAIALFRKALEVNPWDPPATTALMQNLFLAGQVKEAEQLGLALIARQKSYGPIYDMLSAEYLQEKRPADAENMLKMKSANNPTQVSYLMELADYYARAQKTAEMDATLQRILNDPKDFPQGRVLVGDFYLKRRNFPEAIRYYEDGVRTSKNAAKLLYQKRAADALIAEGNKGLASSAVDEIVKENPKDQEARLVQANISLRSGDPAKIDAAERELQNLSVQKPEDASIWLGLGRAEELKGNLDLARAQYVEALKKNKNYLRARYALAEIGLFQNRPDETLQQANEILKVRPADPRARLLHAQALTKSGNSATARYELTRLTQDFPHNAQAQVELGLLALSEKKFHEAEDIFGKLRETGDPRAIAGLARSYASQRQFDKAIEILNDGLKKSNNSVLLLRQIATTEAFAGKYDAAIATFQKLIALEPKSAQERMELADVLSLQGDDNHALAMYAEAAKLAPADLGAGLEFAKALGRAGSVNEARTQYQAVLKAHPDNAMALNDMAFFISENGGNLDQALGFAQRALQSAPGQPSYSDTMGCIYLKKGLSDSALQVFGNLVKKYPNYPAFRYHLGMALLDKGDKKSAKRELETALAAHPSRQDEARIKVLLSKIS